MDMEKQDLCGHGNYTIQGTDYSGKGTWYLLFSCPECGHSVTVTCKTSFAELGDVLN